MTWSGIESVTSITRAGIQCHSCVLYISSWAHWLKRFISTQDESSVGLYIFYDVLYNCTGGSFIKSLVAADQMCSGGFIFIIICALHQAGICHVLSAKGHKGTSVATI